MGCFGERGLILVFPFRGEERIFSQLTSYGPLLWETKARTPAECMEQPCPWLAQLTFLYSHTHLPRDIATHSRLGPPSSFSNQESDRYTNQSDRAIPPQVC